MSTDPANLGIVSVTYDGGATLPVNAGSYAVVANLDNANYAADPAAGTLVIAKANQQISFGALGDKIYGDAAFEVSATGGGSGNAVTFAASGNCTVAVDNGKWMVTLGDAGSCAITASQAGNDNYHAADPVERTFSIQKAAATINLTGLNHTYDGSPKSVSASTNPANLSVVSITYGGSATAPTAAGSYAVEATLDNANYTASPAIGTLVIAKASQTISFGPLADKVFGDAAFEVSAISGASGNAVTFAAVGSNGICSVSGATVSLLGKGTCTIRASQAGNANYEAAPDVDQSFQVAGWTISGFYNPVTMGDPSLVINSVKSGSTVPLKFELFKGSVDQSVPVAANELTSTSAIKSMNAVKYACGQMGGMEDPVDFTAAGKTELRYDSVAGQFIYNWQTPSKQANSCYKVTITMQDSSTLVAYFKLK